MIPTRRITFSEAVSDNCADFLLLRMLVKLLTSFASLATLTRPVAFQGQLSLSATWS